MARIALRILLSLLGASALYTLWLAAAIPAAQSGVRIGLSLLAPLVTATGFTVGLLVGDRLTARTREPFASTYRWPLVGCAAGALAAYPFGPMLIVFGMFTLGTVAILVRELRRGGTRRAG